MKNIILIFCFISFSAFADKKPCGLKGTIDERIQDCSMGHFVLVARINDLNEIYKDTKSGLIWSSQLPSTENHYNLDILCAGLSKINEKRWRLPTIEEFKAANINGIRSALPNMNYHFWSASEYDGNSDLAWLFNGVNGNLDLDYRYNDHSVLCVAR